MTQMTSDEPATLPPQLAELFLVPNPTTDDFKTMMRCIEQLPVEDDELVDYCYSRMDGIATRVGNGAAMCASRMKLAERRRDRGDHRGSLEMAERLLEAARAAGVRRYEGSYCFLVGRLHESAGRYDEARDCFAECYEIYREVGQIDGQRRALNQLGNIYIQHGEPEAALDCYRKCLGLDDGTLQTAEKVAYYDNIGNALRDMGRWEEALEYHYRALAASEQLDTPTDRVTFACYRLNAIGELYSRRAMLDRAIDKFSEVVAASERSVVVRSGGLLADVLANLGKARQRAGDLASAEKNYLLGMRLAEELGDRRAASVLGIRLAELALRQGRTDVGQDLVGQATTLARELGLKVNLSEALRVTALLYAAEGKETEARESYEASLAAIPHLPDSFELAQTRLEYGKFLLKAGETQTAEEHLRQAARVFRQLSVVAEAEETNRLLLSREMASDRGVALLRAVSELTLMRLDPARFLEQCLNLLCDALGYEAGAIIADGAMVLAHGAADAEAAARMATAGRVVPIRAVRAQRHAIFSDGLKQGTEKPAI